MGFKDDVKNSELNQSDEKMEDFMENIQFLLSKNLQETMHLRKKFRRQLIQ